MKFYIKKARGFLAFLLLQTLLSLMSSSIKIKYIKSSVVTRKWLFMRWYSVTKAKHEKFHGILVLVNLKCWSCTILISILSTYMDGKLRLNIAFISRWYVGELPFLDFCFYRTHFCALVPLSLPFHVVRSYIVSLRAFLQSVTRYQHEKHV